jgi:hypothetical protein
LFNRVDLIESTKAKATTVLCENQSRESDIEIDAIEHLFDRGLEDAIDTLAEDEDAVAVQACFCTSL